MGYSTIGYIRFRVHKLNDHNRKILLELLKEVRLNAGLRQVDLAQKLSFPQSMVSKYEVGERRLDILELREICEIFDISFVGFIQTLEQRINEKPDEA